LPAFGAAGSGGCGPDGSGREISQLDMAKSLDESELVGPRQANGDLPAVRFMHPAPGSVLIDKGVDVGLPFRGAAPDLGGV
jgi:hypothetical protein